METVKNELDRISSISDEDITAIGDLMKLYDHVLKLTIWNCGNSGYGWDLSDLASDVNGVICPTSNRTPSGAIRHRQYLKCRLQIGGHKMYLAVFNLEDKLFDVSLEKPT